MIKQGPLLIQEKIRIEIVKALQHANRCETAFQMSQHGEIPYYTNDVSDQVPMILLQGDFGRWAVHEEVVEALEPLLAMVQCNTGIMKGASSLVKF